MKRTLLACTLLWGWFTCATFLVAGAAEPQRLKVLIVDGQNNHDWQRTTPLIQATLEGSGRFSVDVATAPGRGADMSHFRPNFSDYAAVVSNYNGDPWSPETSAALAAYVHDGGGFVSVHAANNSFPEWPEYNLMIGLGGWGGRNEKSGPYVRWRDGQFQRDTSPGGGGSHGARHAFEVVVRDTEHPITAGLPRAFMAAKDELYAQLRGPAKNLQVLATAFSDRKTGGTGEHEPILMAIQYGQGRVFHTTLGHDVEAIHGVAFQVTLQRGTEWVATGQVTLPAVSAELLTADEPALRDPLQLVSAAQVDFSVPPNPQHGEWLALFNGRDLTGWVQRNGTAEYSVVENTILGRTSEGSPNSFLCTEKDFSDFELTFEVKVDDELNSGVQIRSRSLKEFNDGRVHGPQVEIEASPGEAGYIYSEGTGRGWISKEQPPTDAIRNGQWNRYLVRAVGPRIQTWINGRKIEDLSDADSYLSGFIGLQVHGIARGTGPYQVQWRDIQIRNLAQ
jgi:type 1 glutamine amidotransferase